MANKKVSQLTSKPSVLTTDLFPIADPSTGQLYKTTISDLGTAIGSGVSSVNGLVGAVVLDTDDIQELVSPTNKWFTDTRARAALSASSPLTYNSGTGAFGIQVANGSQNGYLSSADWTTFNNKQNALTNPVTGTGATNRLAIWGGTNSITSSSNLYYSVISTKDAINFGAPHNFISYTDNGAFSNLDLVISGDDNIRFYTTNQTKLAAKIIDGGGLDVYGDLTISSTNPRIYLTDTDNNPDYFISNTDGTFTIYDVTNTTARFTIGTTGNATFTNAITGGGSITGQSLYSNGIVSVGTSLSVGTTITATGSVTTSGVYLTGMTSGSGALYYNSGANRVTVANYNTSGIVVFEVNGGSTALTLNSNLSATFADTITATGATLTGALSGTSATFSGAIQAGGGVISGNSNNFYNTASETSVLIKQTAGAAFITQALWNSSTTGDNRFLRFFGESAATNRGGIVYDRTTDKLNLVGEGGGLLFTGASTFLSSITSNNTITANGTSTAGFVTSLLVKNPSTNAASAVKIGFDGGGTTWGEIGTSYNSNSPYMAFFVRANSEKMRITDSGNVGIGTTSPNGSYTLTINGNSSSITGGIVFRQSSTDTFYIGNPATTNTTDFELWNPRAGYMRFATDNSERMRITSGGNVGIGATGYSSTRLLVRGADSTSSNYAFIIEDNGTNNVFLVRNDKAVFAPGVYNFTTGSASNVVVFSDGSMQRSTSSIKYKKNVENYNKGLAEVMQLRAVTYEGKGKVDEGKVFAGLIAEEVHDLGLTEFVQYAEDGTPDALAYQNMVSLLIKGIQELKAELDTLKNK